MSKDPSPNLGYRDAAAAIRFLVSAFGFVEEVVYAGADDSVAHAQLRWPGGGGITLRSVYPGQRSIAGLVRDTQGRWRPA